MGFGTDLVGDVHLAVALVADHGIPVEFAPHAIDRGGSRLSLARRRQAGGKMIWRTPFLERRYYFSSTDHEARVVLLSCKVATFQTSFLLEGPSK